MHVVHVYSGNLYGGIEAMLVTLARTRSNSLSHEFALCFNGRLSRELGDAGAWVHPLAEVRLSRPTTIRRARAALERALRTRPCDAVALHAPWSHAIFAPTVRQARLPLVFWAHDVMTGRHWTERLAARTPPDLVICNSQFTRSTMHNLFRHPPASTVVYPPVAITAGDLRPDVRRALRSSLSTEPDDVVIVTACRSEAWKGHQVLIEALGAIRDLRGWVWWQVGGAQRPRERQYQALLRRLAERHQVLDRVRWVGERADVPQLLRAADLYCQPNVAPEPFGIAFVEALAAGLPVVTTAFGGGAEIVTPACGVLVPPADPHALGGALRQLIANRARRASLGSHAPARARELSDPHARLDEIYQALAGIGCQTSAGALS